MRLKIVLTFLLLSSICFGQNEKHTSVDYAGNIIEIPKDYKSKTEYDISGNGFRASWMYFPAGVDIQEIGNQITNQFESQLPLTEPKDIAFLSSNSDFIGKKYLLDNKSYVVLGFGTINNQPLFLNMSFEKEPISNKDFDELMKKFIVYKENNR